MLHCFVTNRCHPGYLFAMALLLALEGVSLSHAQMIEPRVVAAYGPELEEPVWETAIAAGEDRIIAVFNVAPRGNSQVGYAMATYNEVQEQWIWGEEGLIPLGNEFGPDSRTIDPSIAFDPLTGDFMAAALVLDPSAFPNVKHIVLSRYDATGAPPQFEAWWSVAQREGSFSLDKPWIVAGEVIAGAQEYYIVYMDDDGTGTATGYAYRRSTDGGVTWWPEDDEDGVIRVKGHRVMGYFCAQPAVVGNDPLYVAYMAEGGGLCGGAKIQFLRGTDIDGGRVGFAHLHGPGGSLAPTWECRWAPLYVPLICARQDDNLPGSFPSRTVPQLAADPTDPGRLYLVYQDVASESGPGSSDVNIYLRKLTGPGGTCGWSADPPIIVNDDQTPYESDQFLPSVTVDAQGRVHVIFYDDRNYNITSDQLDGTENPMFDVYYAVSTDYGQTFANHELYSDPPETALDFRLPIDPDFEPGEYIGIASYQDALRDEVWTSFSGTSSGDSASDKSVIHSTLIDFWE